jgi:hypothetical protein
LVANVQQDEYSIEVGSTAGIIVLPLPQNIMPFPEDDGILVSPGHAASIGLTTVSQLVAQELLEILLFTAILSLKLNVSHENLVASSKSIY